MSTAITTKENGKFNLVSLESQLSFADSLIRQRVISETFKTPQQVVIAIQFCLSLNIDPMTGLKMMYVVHGKPALYGDGPLSLIQSSGKLDWIKEFWVDDDGNEICVKNKNLKSEPYAAVCQIKRVGDDNVQEDFFTQSDMNLAQLKNNVWNKYQRTMMRYRARTQALKSKFADLLNGIEIAEYVTQDLPKENMVIENKSPEKISESQIEEINDLIKETNTDPKAFLSYMELESFDLFNAEDAKKAINALNQKKEAQNV